MERGKESRNIRTDAPTSRTTPSPIIDRGGPGLTPPPPNELARAFSVGHGTSATDHRRKLRESPHLRRTRRRNTREDVRTIRRETGGPRRAVAHRPHAESGVVEFTPLAAENPRIPRSRSRTRPVQSKNPQEARDVSCSGWLGIFGPPKSIQMDEGGERKNAIWTDSRAECRINLQFQGVEAHPW